MTSPLTADGGITFDWIDGGGVTTPAGFVAGGIYAGIKTYGPEPRLDVGIIAAEGETPLVAAGVFTKNAVTGHPVTHDRKLLASTTEVRERAARQDPPLPRAPDSSPFHRGFLDLAFPAGAPAH